VTLRTDKNTGWALDHGFVEVEPGWFEKRVHVGLLYHYREIHRNLLFDRWLAEHATSQRR
jgi:urease beta subunit